MSDPFVSQKIASEIFALREFLLVEHGHIGWVHTLKVWHEQMLDELRVRAAPREPSPTKQKFHAGDLVRVAANTGHWTDARDAIVTGSYRDLFESHGTWGANDERTYDLYFEEVGGAAWYDEDDLMLIENGRFDLWECWRNANRAAFEARMSGNAVSDKGVGVERAAEGESK